MPLRRRCEPTLAASIAAVVGCSLGPAGCDAVLGLEPWDAEPGAGGGAAASTVATAGPGGGEAVVTGPSTATSASTSGGEGGGEGGGATTGGGGGAGGDSCDLGSSEHCGACGRSCWGGACTEGVCAPAQLAALTARQDLIAVSGDHVVWFDGSGALQHVRKSAPGTVENLGGDVGDITSLEAADVGGGHHAAFYASGSQITRRLLDQDDPSPITPVDDVRFAPAGIQPQSGFLYWYEVNAEGEAGVRRSSWNTRSASTLYCAGASIRDLTMAGDVAFFIRYTSSGWMLMRYPGFGGASNLLAADVGHLADQVVADPTAGHVYYSTFYNGGVDPPIPSAIWRKPVDGGPSTMVQDVGQGLSAHRLDHGGRFLYWRNAAELRATTKQPSGGVEVVAGDQVSGFAADAEGVYWSSVTGVWALRRD